MSKSIKLKDDVYIDDSGVTHNRVSLDKKINGSSAMGDIAVNSISSKNKFDIKNIPSWVGANTSYSISDSSINIKGAWFVGFKVYNLKKNTNYFVSVDKVITTLASQTGLIAIMTEDASSFITSFYENKYFNTGDRETIYILFYSGAGEDQQGDVTFSNIQIEEGIEKTDYRPYANYGDTIVDVLFSDSVNGGNTYNLLGNLNNYKILVFSLFMGGNSTSIMAPYRILHEPGYIGRVELRCYENASSLTEIIMDLAFLNDTQVICDRCGYKPVNSDTVYSNPYGLKIYGIR